MKQVIAGLFACSILSVVGAGCMSEVGSDEDGDVDAIASDGDDSSDVAPEPKRHMVFQGADQQPTGEAPIDSTPGAIGISYHGGPVMTSTVKMYYIWYGNWSGNTATTILTDLANSIGGSPYWNINTTYNNGSTPVTGSVQFGGSTTNNYSNGTKLTDNAIKSIVSNAITSGALPKDANGVYLVLTSADVTATTGFCTQYCGWHTYASIGGTNIKYSFVGNPDRCPNACAWQTSSPNGNAGADGMASIIAHEVEEAATDPQLNAWYDSSGYENADKCAWTFGTTWSSGGGVANVHLGTRDYLIQRNWNANTGACTMSNP
jgi:hypothetical protein